MAARRTAKQKAASRQNLEKARRAKKHSASNAAWTSRQQSLAPSTLLSKYNKALQGLKTAKHPDSIKSLNKKAEIYWDAYVKAKKR